MILTRIKCFKSLSKSRIRLPTHLTAFESGTLQVVKVASRGDRCSTRSWLSLARVMGHVEAGSVSVQGTLQAHSTVNVSGAFAGSGCFTVAETLRAATVDFLLDSRSQCRVDSMTTTGDIVFAKSRPGAGRLVARRVAAGGDVRLVATEAAVVRGRRVLIGPDCNIGVVEYLESCDVAPSSVVGEAKQVAAL